MERGVGPIQPVYQQPFRPMLGQSHTTHTLGAAATVIYQPPGARYIRFQALAQNIRYTLDGTTPTVAIGFQLAASAVPIIIDLTERTILTVFRESSGAILEYQFGD